MGFFVEVDFEQAFDLVLYIYSFQLLKVFDLFGFGHLFYKWRKIFHTWGSGCVTNGGFSNGYFDIQRGVQ